MGTGFDLTDHLPNFLIINKLSSLPKNYKSLKRDYSYYNEARLSSDIQSINWEDELPNSKDVNLLFDSFYSKLSSIVDTDLPLKQLSKREIKQMSKLWITRSIKQSLKIKNIFFLKKYIKTGLGYNYDKYKLYRNKLNHQIRLSKKDYYYKYFNSNKANIRNIWRGIKRIISVKPLSSRLPSKIVLHDNSEIFECRQIATAFNENFSNFGDNMANSIPTVNKTAMSYLLLKQSQSCCLYPTIAVEIEDVIDNLNSTKATGP